MLNRAALSFDAQRQALAQAAAQQTANGPDFSVMEKSLASAGGLLAAAMQPTVQAVPEMTKEEAMKLMGSLEGYGNNKDRYSEAQSRLSESPAGIGVGPMNASEQQIYEGLRARGLSDIQARGSVINFMDESGLVADVTEGAPNVHGTRGQGLYQLTDNANGKGRRADYLNWMKAQGRNDLWSVDSQLDNFIREIQGPEKTAWQKFANAQTVGEFASGMVGDFLRPAAEHRISRQKKYMSLGI